MPWNLGTGKTTAGTWSYIDRRKPWQKKCRTMTFCKTGCQTGWNKKLSFKLQCPDLWSLQGMEGQVLRESLEHLGFVFGSATPEPTLTTETDDNYLARIRQLLAA